MIVGVGVDIVEIERIKKSYLKNPRFLTRVFTGEEIDYARKGEELNYNSLAAMWASKEAYAKATGQGFRGFGLRDVEVVRDDLGAPSLRLYNQAASFCQDRNVHLSISHSDISAIAFCIIESKEG